MDLPTYEEFWTDFRSSGYEGSFTDYLVSKIHTMYKNLLKKMEDAEERLRTIEQRMVPRAHYEQIARQLESTRQQLEFERSRNAADNARGHARTQRNTATDPQRGVQGPDPLRGSHIERIREVAERLQRDGTLQLDHNIWQAEYEGEWRLQDSGNSGES